MCGGDVTSRGFEEICEEICGEGLFQLICGVPSRPDGEGSRGAGSFGRKCQTNRELLSGKCPQRVGTCCASASSRKRIKRMPAREVVVRPAVIGGGPKPAHPANGVLFWSTKRTLDFAWMPSWDGVFWKPLDPPGVSQKCPQRAERSRAAASIPKRCNRMPAQAGRSPLCRHFVDVGSCLCALDLVFVKVVQTAPPIDLLRLRRMRPQSARKVRARCRAAIGGGLEPAVVQENACSTAGTPPTVRVESAQTRPKRERRATCGHLSDTRFWKKMEDSSYRGARNRRGKSRDRDEKL